MKWVLDCVSQEVLCQGNVIVSLLQKVLDRSGGQIGSQ